MLACMQDTFAPARPSARATIGYLVYKVLALTKTRVSLMIIYEKCLIFLNLTFG